jgi:hypothetical protein
MEIKGKVHCFFEQSGTFKNEFKKLGYEAFDYDIQNNFGETDNVVDLFKAIEDAYDGKPSLFDNISEDDLIMAFFPCIYFCDSNNLYFQDTCCNLDRQFKDDIKGRYAAIIQRNKNRIYFYELLWKLVCIVKIRKLRFIMENPWDLNGLTFLQRNFIAPSIIDKNRMLRGDFYIKPTAYWFLNCEHTCGFSYQNDKKQRKIRTGSIKDGVRGRASGKAGICSEDRSMISPDYARNFICDFVLGKKQDIGQLTLF